MCVCMYVCMHARACVYACVYVCLKRGLGYVMRALMSHVNITNVMSHAAIMDLTRDQTSKSHELNVCVAMEYRLWDACLDESREYHEFDESCKYDEFDESYNYDEFDVSCKYDES